jgi:AcrR family transcriptional regulator
MAEQRKNLLSAQDWADAALETIGTHGIEGVAVEALARELGVTKGSFYWHFANREALIVAALDLWEARETDTVLERVVQETDPRARIKRLITEVNASRRASRVYMALANATTPAFVHETVERVSQRRFDFIADCYRALGLPAATARQWALMTFSVFLGSLQLRRELPGEWPAADSPEFGDYLRFLIANLVPSQPAEHADANAAGQTIDRSLRCRY